MILAAGRGQRLAPLTDRVPKPLVEVGGSTLIERHLARFAAVGVTEVVINVAHLAAQIEAHIGDGGRYGLRVSWSREPEGALDTGGGIAHALPLLGADPFWVVNGDVWTDYPLRRGPAPAALAHLVLVPNPAGASAGDFAFSAGRAHREGPRAYTYAGIALLRPALFARCARARFPLAPLLFEQAARGALSAELHRGRWYDIGTPERLAAARAALIEY